MNINANIEKIRQSGTIALADRVRSLKKAGREVIELNVGEPDFETHGEIIEATHRGMLDGFTKYSDSRGLLELREAVAAKLYNFNEVEYDPSAELLITGGAVHAYYTALQAIVNPGDEILVPDPSWMTHTNLIELLRGKAVHIPAFEKNDFMPNIEDFEEAVTHKTIALVINFPSNPTGAVADKNYLSRLNELAKERGLYIISDEVYERIVYDGCRNTCMASVEDAKERTILLNSFSKTYAMTGWRIGYLAAPGKIVANALKASQYSITNVPAFAQKGALRALESRNVEVYVEKMVKEYAERRGVLLDLFNGLKDRSISVHPPRGAFYLFLNVGNLFPKSLHAAEKLLEDTGIALVPGSFFGRNGEGYLRLSLSAAEDDLREGFKRIRSWLEKSRNESD